MVDITTTVPLLLFGVGAGLIILEAIIPGAHSMVFGVSLFGTGLVSLLIQEARSPLIMAALVIVFGALAFYGYRRAFNLHIDDQDEDDRTLDKDSLVGSEGYVMQEVTQRDGTVFIDGGGGFDSTYSARAAGEIEVIDEGTDIVVVDSGGGNIVQVEPKAGEE